MARQTLTKTTPLGRQAAKYTANAADMTMMAAIVADKEQFAASDKDLVIAHNTDGGSAYTVTVSSVADAELGRTGDIATYSIGAGEFAIFGPLRMNGWRQTNGKIYLEASNAAIKFGVVALP